MFTKLKPALAVALAAWAAAHAEQRPCRDWSHHDCHRSNDRRITTGRVSRFARTGQGGPAQWTRHRRSDGIGRSRDRADQHGSDRLPVSPCGASTRRRPQIWRWSSASRPSRGKVDQAGGIALRLRDADNYYVARANALEDNVRFYRVVKGRREQLEGANLKVSANEWHSAWSARRGRPLHGELRRKGPLHVRRTGRLPTPARWRCGRSRTA